MRRADHAPRLRPRGGAGRSAARVRLLLAAALLVAGPAVLGAQSLPRAVPEDVGVSSERLDRLSDALARYVEEGRLPGAVALVARYGHIVFLEAHGQRDLASADPLETDDLFRIASQSKAIVSVAIMMLQEEGKLLIGHPVSRYLPAFERTSVAVGTDDGEYEIVEADRAITIRDLLTHTAGIGYGYGPAADRWVEAGIQGWYFADRDEPIRATVDRMAELPFDAQPGERFVYGYSTDILGAVVEAASGVPLDRFLEDRLLGPLGMDDTYFYVPPGEADRLAKVYSVAEGGLEPAPDPGGMVGQGAYVEGPRASFSGGAGLLSTAGDYARFLQMLVNGGELDGTRILGRKSVELMTVNHVGDLLGAGAGFGLGFEVTLDVGERGEPGSVGAFGWGGAYHSTYWADPSEGLVVVYFTQVIPAAGLDDHGMLRALVYQALTDDVLGWQTPSGSR